MWFSIRTMFVHTLKYIGMFQHVFTCWNAGLASCIIICKISINGILDDSFKIKDTLNHLWDTWWGIKANEKYHCWKVNFISFRNASTCTLCMHTSRLVLDKQVCYRYVDKLDPIMFLINKLDFKDVSWSLIFYIW